MNQQAHLVRVLYTIPNFTTAGSGHAMFSVASRLDRAHFTPHICLEKPGGALETAAREADIPVLVQPFTAKARPLPGLPGRLWRAAQGFRAHRFDLWHSYHYADDYTEPIIARLSGARAWIYTKKNMSWGGRAWKLRSWLAARIGAQNSAMRRQFFANPRGQARSRLIPPGVDVQRFRPGVEPHLRMRERLNLTAETPLIGCVAHLVLVKGHPTLIEAMASLHDTGTHLVLAGRPADPEYAAALRNQVDALGLSERIHFWGEVADIPALHAELDVFVLPTLGRLRMEGCPVAMLEAMACGLPCVVSDIPGPQDVIQNGINGILVPPEDAGALAAALRGLLGAPDLRQAMGEAARERVRAGYTIEGEVQAYQELYMEALGRR